MLWYPCVRGERENVPKVDCTDQLEVAVLNLTCTLYVRFLPDQYLHSVAVCVHHPGVPVFHDALKVPLIVKAITFARAHKNGWLEKSV